MRDDNTIKISVLWTQLLRIYKEIEVVCKRHGLRVYGIFGTQLGAIRHAGFIPWDDDLDLAMPRNDYEKFLSVAPQELGRSLSVVSWKNDPTYKLLFAKVILNDAEIVKKVSLDSGLRLPQGVFVDIFPFDGCYGLSIREVIRVARKALYKLANYAFGVPKKNDIKFMTKRFLGRMICFFIRAHNIKELLAMEENLARQCPYDDAKYVNLYCWLKFAYIALFRIGRGQGYFTRDMFGAGVNVPFESTSILIPEQSDKILKLRYGDYMKLPPENQRVPMHSESSVEDSEWRLGPQNFKQQPILSIVIANYNYGRFIEDAILSVIKQCVSVAKGNKGQTVLTLENGETIELIICDGGSSDNSLEVIKKYSDSLTWWESCKDRGQSHAFNKGFLHANGKLLTWLNADDLMLPGAIRSLVTAHRKYPEAEWFIGGCVWTDVDLKIVKCTRARKIQNHVAECGYVPVYSPSSFFTKSVLMDAGGLNEQYHYKMDTLLWLQFYFEQNLRPKVLPGYIFCLRMHADAKVSGVQFCNKNVPLQHAKETEWLNAKWPRRKISKLRQLFAFDSYKILLNIRDTLMFRNKQIGDAIQS